LSIVGSHDEAQRLLKLLAKIKFNRILHRIELINDYSLSLPLLNLKLSYLSVNLFIRSFERTHIRAGEVKFISVNSKPFREDYWRESEDESTVQSFEDRRHNLIYVFRKFTARILVMHVNHAEVYPLA